MGQFPKASEVETQFFPLHTLHCLKSPVPNLSRFAQAISVLFFFPLFSLHLLQIALSILPRY